MTSSRRVYVIAEAGVNHNGSIDRALELVEAAQHCGADAVKFQTFDPAQLASRHAGLADYQARQLGNDQTQIEMLNALVLSQDDHRVVRQHCKAQGIDFLSSPFDIDSALFLRNTMGLSRIKLGSGELTNGPLLLALARMQVDLILSTGMSDLDEVRQALAVIAFGYQNARAPDSLEEMCRALDSASSAQVLHERVTLLHCTTEYPCPVAEVNLAAMDTLAHAFQLPVGYSDHTDGIAIAIAAAARGACLIEKHLTLDRNLPGPDHKASLEPAAFAAMVSGVREVESAIGDGAKRATASELRNLRVARKSLVAARPIAAGQRFDAADLTSKRPGTGRSPMQFWNTLGRPSARTYDIDDVIDE